MITMLHDLAVLSANSLLEYLHKQLSKPIVIEDIVHPVTINEDGEEEYESISQMPSQSSHVSQVILKFYDVSPIISACDFTIGKTRR